jgi:hypothetical protein
LTSRGIEEGGRVRGMFQGSMIAQTLLNFTKYFYNLKNPQMGERGIKKNGRVGEFNYDIF